MNRRLFLRALRARRRSPSLSLPCGTANAEALRDKWCKDVHIRFFVGGAEGDAFGTIVYNGAKQAAERHRRAGRLRLLRLDIGEDGAAAPRGGCRRSPTASP